MIREEELQSKIFQCKCVPMKKKHSTNCLKEKLIGPMHHMNLILILQDLTLCILFILSQDLELNQQKKLSFPSYILSILQVLKELKKLALMEVNSKRPGISIKVFLTLSKWFSHFPMEKETIFLTDKQH